MPFPPPKLQYKLAVIDIQEHRMSRLALWRSTFILSCFLGLGLLTTMPFWQIKKSSQISIDGHKLVSKETIKQSLDFSYPQFIWGIQVADLTQKLESIPSIEAAKIDKQIIPPQVIISLQERIPIAIASHDGKMGFLDSDGTWIERQFYTNLDGNFALPQLVVHRYQFQYRKTWQTLYQLITLYPELKIDEVRWNHSGNLFLHAKIGKVALGTNSSRLSEQFKIMLKLQNLNQQVDRHKIAYIDLSNPEANLIQKY